MFRRGFASLLLIGICVPSLYAQQRQTGRPGVGIPNTTAGREARLEIELVDENYRPVQAQALVEVSSSGAVNLRTYTNTDGRANLTVSTGTSYHVRASGNNFKSEDSSFEVYPGETYHRETVTVKMVEANGGTPAAPGGIISASQFNVPEKARKEYEKGMEAYRDKKWDKALEHFDKAVKDYPQFDSAYNSLGVAAMQKGDVVRARDAFVKAVQINDRNPSATRNLGRIFLVQDKDPARAKEMFSKSLSADPRSGETLTLLAYADLQSGDFDGALLNARKVHSSGPQDQFPFAHLIAGRVLEKKGDTSGAATEYRTYLKEAENTPDAKVAKDGLARLGMPQR